MYIYFSYTFNAHRAARGLQIYPLRVYCSQRICRIGAAPPRRYSMKNLILIGGAMGAGKTTVCQKLKPLLAPSAFLDGDWCWDMEPFRVTDAAKAMVMDNIAAVLSNLLRCPDFESVLFCWVLPEREIAEALLARLPLEGVRVHRFTLTLTEEALVSRLRGDIARGLRGDDVIPRALDRLKRCNAAGGELLDTTRLSPDEVAAEIAARVKHTERASQSERSEKS